MKVVLYGATGKAGSCILRELLLRGHKVVAVVRDTKKVTPADGLVIQTGDLSDATKTAETIKGADAVISAYAPPLGNTDQLINVTRILIEAVATSGVPRLLMVGGAGSLEVAPGVSLIDSGHLPPEWLPIALSHSKALDLLRTSNIDWTNLSPAAYFGPGARTGTFRLGGDNLISDEKGESRISMEDYAIAMVDELETARHKKQRFSVGY